MLFVGEADRQSRHDLDLLQQVCRLEDPEAGKAQLSRAQVPDVFRHDGLRTSGDGELDEMVVALVPEVWSPPVVDVGPMADAQEAIQNGLSLCQGEKASLEQLGSRQERLVLCEEGGSHERAKTTVETGAQNLAAGTRGAQESRDKDAGVKNDDPEVMIAYGPSRWSSKRCCRPTRDQAIARAEGNDDSRDDMRAAGSVALHGLSAVSRKRRGGQRGRGLGRGTLRWLAMKERSGLLLINLGTPDAPRPPEVRRYLREFLSDPRVLDMPAFLRFLLLELVILPRRPRASAAAYQKIWRPEGSPLLVHGRALAAKVQALLGDAVQVELAMRYGQPAIAPALDRFAAAGVSRLTVFPLYPQYSSAATGSVIEEVERRAAGRWSDPDLRIAPPFYDHPAYVEARAEVARPFLTPMPE